MIQTLETRQHGHCYGYVLQHDASKGYERPFVALIEGKGTFRTLARSEHVTREGATLALVQGMHERGAAPE